MLSQEGIVTGAGTGGTLSQTAAAGGTSTDALVEHTSSFVTYANLKNVGPVSATNKAPR